MESSRGASVFRSFLSFGFGSYFTILDPVVFAVGLHDMNAMVAAPSSGPLFEGRVRGCDEILPPIAGANSSLSHRLCR